MSWTGFGYLGMTPASSSRARTRGLLYRAVPPPGRSSRYESSLAAAHARSADAPAAFARAVVPAGAALGTAATTSNWAALPINHNDPQEVALAADLQNSALSHVAESTRRSYVGPWNQFVSWCNSLSQPRSPLPASDATVALYLQFVFNRAQRENLSFSLVKSASAAIAFFQKVNLFDHLPTLSPAACLVRAAAGRKLGLAARNRKSPFLWQDVVRFASAYGPAAGPVPYCHLVIVTFCVVSFGAMCRHSDLSPVRHDQLSFTTGSDAAVTIKFTTRKNDQYRKGSQVTIAAIPDSPTCPVRLLHHLSALTCRSPSDLVFQNFDGRLIAANRAFATQPLGNSLSRSQYIRYLALWFGSILDLDPSDFRSQYGASSGRSGAASAAANAGVPVEQWGAHGGWQSHSSQIRYMERDTASILSVSRTIMPSTSTTPRTPELLDVRTNPGDPADDIDEDSIPDVQDIPDTFRWSN